MHVQVGVARVTKTLPPDAGETAARRRGSAVPHLAGARLGDEQVEHGDVVQCAVADREQRGNRAAPIEHEVKNLPHVHLF